MDCLMHYKQIANDINLKEDKHSNVPEYANAKISQSNKNILNLNRVFHPDYDKVKRLHDRNIDKLSKTKSLVSKGSKTISIRPDISWHNFKFLSRNKPKWTIASQKKQSLSLFKTSLKQSSSSTNSLRIAIKKNTNLCNTQSPRVALPVLNDSSINNCNTTNESPYPVITEQGIKISRVNSKKHLTINPDSVGRTCLKLERDCLNTGKGVKRIPIQLVNKQAMNNALNNSMNIYEDIVDGHQKKFNIEDMIEVSGKIKRIMKEADCIHKLPPSLAMKSIQSVKRIFTIKTSNRGNDALPKKKNFLQQNKGRIISLLNKTNEGHSRCQEKLDKCLKLNSKHK